MCTNHGCGCHVYLCVLVSVAMCIPVGLCVGGCASAIGVADSSTSYYSIPSGRTTTHSFVCCRYYCIAGQVVYSIPHTMTPYGISISSYPSVSWSVSSCELHYNIPVRSRTGCCIAGTAVQHTGRWSRGWWILHTLTSYVPS